MSSSIFNSVVTPKKRYNNFNLSREVLVSGQIGKLIPVQCDDVVPGDRFRQGAAFLMRFAPLSAPAMARFNVHFHTFYVPLRIITPRTGPDSTYERFIKSIGKASEDVPLMPYFAGTYTGSNPTYNALFKVGSLWDYLGLPVSTTGNPTIPSGLKLSALYHFAYQRIYQDFYRRDQIEKERVFNNNISSVALNNPGATNYGGVNPELDDNQELASLFSLLTLRTRNYERDYFTSALPEPQFGDEVSVGDGSISWIGESGFNFVTSGDVGGSTAELLAPWPTGTVGVENGYLTVDNGSTDSSVWGLKAGIKLSDGIMERMTDNLRGNSFTINDFRLAMQLQGIKETINRVGTRYLEIMQGIYGVRVPDARLQRPIYLGGFKNPVSIGSVMQTSESDTTPQGTLTGNATSVGSDNLVSSGYEFKEHGILMTIMSVTPRTSYFGGIPRKFLKVYPEDYYLPQFDHLGEQEINKLELYANFDDNTKNKNEVFGYTPRYSELKSAFSSVHGEFRTTLENWHVSRDFDEAPSLNTSFIQADPEDFSRIFEFENITNTSNEHFYCQIYLNVHAKRNMSKFSTPWTLY